MKHRLIALELKHNRIESEYIHMYKKSYEFMNLVYQNMAKHIPVRGMPEKNKGTNN